MEEIKQKDITFEDLMIDNYINKLSKANHRIAILEIENLVLQNKVKRLEGTSSEIKHEVE